LRWDRGIDRKFSGVVRRGGGTFELKDEVNDVRVLCENDDVSGGSLAKDSRTGDWCKYEVYSKSFDGEEEK
jgi:hypothetical protein